VQHYELIFNILDEDRSGTIDFDEFTHWIIQAAGDAQCTVQEIRAHQTGDDSEARIPQHKREKLLASAKSKVCASAQGAAAILRALLAMAKGRGDYIHLEAFKSIVSRLNLGLTMREARAIFYTIDLQASDVITASELTTWWTKAFVGPLPEAEAGALTFEEKMSRVTGTEKHIAREILRESFEQYVKDGADAKIDFDEFSQVLRSRRMMCLQSDAKALFDSLDSEHRGYLQVRTMMDSILGAYRGSLTRAMKPKETIHHSGTLTHEETELLMKRSTSMRKTRVGRELRQAMRKSYQRVVEDLKAYMPTCKKQNGYIGFSALKLILDRHCVPLTFTDLRLAMRDVRHDDLGRIEYKHLLEVLHPATTERASTTTGTWAGNAYPITRSVPRPPNPTTEAQKPGNGQVKVVPDSRVHETSELGAVEDAMKRLLSRFKDIQTSLHEVDAARCGTIARADFVAILEAGESLEVRHHPQDRDLRHSYLQGLAPEAVAMLVHRYESPPGRIDYVAFLRDLMYGRERWTRQRPLTACPGAHAVLEAKWLTARPASSSGAIGADIVGCNKPEMAVEDQAAAIRSLCVRCGKTISSSWRRLRAELKVSGLLS
jgi:Ca2+-binding EF-hand superfamily protein